MTKQGNQSINTNGSRCNQAFQTRCKSNYNWVEPNYISWDPMMQDTTGQARSTWQHTVVTTKVGVFYSAIASTSMCRSKVLVKKCSLINLSKIWGMCCHLLRLGHPWTLLLSFWKKKLLLSLGSNYISLPSALFGISLATKILESLQLALKDTKLSQSVHTSPKSQWQPVSSNVWYPQAFHTNLSPEANFPHKLLLWF